MATQLAAGGETLRNLPRARRRVSGGKTVYGARLGILSLETRFPRVPGDMGNAGT